MSYKKSIRGGDYMSASEVVGKTLIARTSVPLTRWPKSDSPVIYTAKAGESVGVVYSWVMEGTKLYWMFYDQYGKPYYAEHKTGRFSVEALQQQGAKTLQDIQEAKAKEENPIAYTITQIVKPLVWAGTAYFIIKAFR